MDRQTQKSPATSAALSFSLPVQYWLSLSVQSIHLLSIRFQFKHRNTNTHIHLAANKDKQSTNFKGTWSQPRENGCLTQQALLHTAANTPCDPFTHTTSLEKQTGECFSCFHSVCTRIITQDGIGIQIIIHFTIFQDTFLYTFLPTNRKPNWTKTY